MGTRKGKKVANEEANEEAAIRPEPSDIVEDQPPEAGVNTVEEDEEDPSYVIEDIVGCEVRILDGKPILAYCVKWEGYSSLENTWEAESGFDNCKPLLWKFRMDNAAWIEAIASRTAKPRFLHRKRMRGLAKRNTYLTEEQKALDQRMTAHEKEYKALARRAENRASEPIAEAPKAPAPAPVQEAPPPRVSLRERRPRAVRHPCPEDTSAGRAGTVGPPSPSPRQAAHPEGAGHDAATKKREDEQGVHPTRASTAPAASPSKKKAKRAVDGGGEGVLRAKAEPTKKRGRGRGWREDTPAPALANRARREEKAAARLRSQQAKAAAVIEQAVGVRQERGRPSGSKNKKGKAQAQAEAAQVPNMRVHGVLGIIQKKRGRPTKVKAM